MARGGEPPDLLRTERALLRLARLRTELIASVRKAPDPPAPGPGAPWTPVQILQHLMLAEEVALGQMRRGLAEDRRRPTLRHRVGRVAVKVVFHLRLRVRTPISTVVPEPPLELAEVERRWEAAGRGIEVFLRERARSAPGDPVFRHPIAGPLGPAAAVELLLTHVRHHAAQVRERLPAG